MAVIVREEASEDVEWFDEEKLDLSNISLPTSEENHGVVSVIAIEEHFNIPWENENV